MKQLGTNPCVIEGTSLTKNDTVNLSCDSESKSFNFLEGKYPHSLRFKVDDVKESNKKNITDYFKRKELEDELALLDTEKRTKRLKLSKESENELSEDNGAESDDESTRRVQNQLKLMRENFKKTERNTPKSATKFQVMIIFYI